MGIDLATDRGVETSYERLEALLRRQAPDLALRLGNAAVWLLGDDRASLTRALEIADAETPRRRRSP